MRERTSQARDDVKARLVARLRLFGNEVLDHLTGCRTAEEDGSHPMQTMRRFRPLL
jgi:hypothetical protein